MDQDKTQKTEIPVNTPLLPKASAILKKYETDHRAISSGKLFPMLSNQKMNSYLKEIAELCMIAKKFIISYRPPYIRDDGHAV